MDKLSAKSMSNSPIAKPSVNSPKTSAKKLPQTPQAEEDISEYEAEMASRTYLPQCWTDTKRMNSLFNEFRAREANPDGFDLKISFWINAINKWSLLTSSAVFTAKDVQNAFQRANSKPNLKCIQLVLSHMKRNKSVVYYNEFIKSDTNQSWITWGMGSLVIAPINFGISLLAGDRDVSQSEKILSDMTDETQFINIETLKLLALELISYAENKSNNVSNCLSYDNLYSKCKFKLNISSDTFELLISHLEYENKLTVSTTDNGIKIVKFGKNAQINELDISAIKLEAYLDRI